MYTNTTKSKMSSERRRNDLPLSKKYEAVMMLKEKISQSAVARKLKCSQSQISRITSKQEEIIAAYKSDSNPDRKRQRVGHEPKIEEALTQWFVGARSKEIPLTGTMIAEQAKKIANEFDQKQFVPTSGWLSRWKDRNNVRWDLKKRCLKPVATGKNGIKDVFCDPDNPRVLQFQDVSAAAYKIKDGIQKTPCTKDHSKHQLSQKSVLHLIIMSLQLTLQTDGKSEGIS
ncbi:hypothetical protein KUTeg_016701 [Tegillarca granosa]|uniref:HTH CENPB-type domain-containing protein n=1 Tax=Tegillarca granosa TaxID=220873 RepID=A0ABQ9ELN3_TEGGR|nr:hypothetical protein KUTeg_016701 [Tegillarca granosa]